MGVLKVFLYACSGAFALGSLILARVTWGLGSKLDGFVAALMSLTILGIGGFLAWSVFKAARKYTVQASQEQHEQFERLVRQLAAKNGGAVALSDLMRFTGDERPQAEAKMRHLMSRGVCEMDFDDKGEVLLRLSPGDEARAAIARLEPKG